MTDIDDRTVADQLDGLGNRLSSPASSTRMTSSVLGTAPTAARELVAIDEQDPEAAYACIRPQVAVSA